MPTFLSIVGPATYAILRDLFAPALPSSVTLADIFERLKKHYEPKRATIVERYHFHKRDQLEGETATQYDAALRKLATHCQFADYLEEALRDRFVCGLRLFNDDCSQRRNSHSQKLWTLPFQWRQLRKILAPSKVMIHQLRRSRNSIDLVHTRPHSNPATDVGRPTMQLTTANSRLPFVTLVGRRATLPQSADLCLQQIRKECNNAANELIWCNKIPLTRNLRNTLCLN